MTRKTGRIPLVGRGGAPEPGGRRLTPRIEKRYAAIPRALYERAKVGLTDDPSSVALGDKLLGLSML